MTGHFVTSSSVNKTRGLRQRLLSLAVSVVLVSGVMVPYMAYADEAETSADNTVNVSQVPDSSFLYDVPISELSSADSFHDEQTVQVKGEVVGDLVNEESGDTYGWITLQEQDSDNPSVVSVYIKKDLTTQIDAWGHYGQRGTTLQVRGTFHLACPDHQGASDIHAETASVVAKGETITYNISSLVFTFAWLFPVVGIGLMIYYRHRNEQER